MPFNGSGSFNTVFNWQTDAANGLDISSSRMQGQDQDFASGLSICMTKDGQQVATNNLPMGGFTLTNLGNATGQRQPVSVADFQNGTPTWVGTVSGTDTITGAANIAPAAYAAGQKWRGITAGANLTAVVTMNFNGLGAVPVIKNGVPIAIGDFAGEQVFEVTYDGTSMQVGNIGSAKGSLINIQLVTATAPYAPSAGANSAIIDMGAAGGAGGGAVAVGGGGQCAGAGGAAGNYLRLFIPSSLQTYAGTTLTVGAAGVGVVGGNGGNGGNSTFGALATAFGGNGGLAGIAVAGPIGGGAASFLLATCVLNAQAPTTTLTALDKSIGAAGGDAFGSSAVIGFLRGGDGGDSPLGSGGYGTRQGPYVAGGAAGSGMGAGGGGAATFGAALAGFNGAPGGFIIYEMA